MEVFGDSSRDADNSGNDQDNDGNSSIIAFWELVGREISLLSFNGGLGSLVFGVLLVVLSNKILACFGVSIGGGAVSSLDFSGSKSKCVGGL